MGVGAFVIGLSQIFPFSFTKLTIFKKTTSYLKFQLNLSKHGEKSAEN